MEVSNVSLKTHRFQLLLPARPLHLFLQATRSDFGNPIVRISYGRKIVDQKSEASSECRQSILSAALRSPAITQLRVLAILPSDVMSWSDLSIVFFSKEKVVPSDLFGFIDGASVDILSIMKEMW